MNTSKPTNASPDEVQTVITTLKQLHETMTFLTPLSAEQRGALRAGRMGPRTWSVLQSRLEAARQHRDLLPPTFDLRKFERDVELAGDLQGCLARLDQMREGVSDTLIALGNRVLQAGAAAYGYINVATSNQAARTRVLRVARRSRARRTNPAEPAAPSSAPQTPPEQASPPAAAPAPSPVLRPPIRQAQGRR